MIAAFVLYVGFGAVVGIIKELEFQRRLNDMYPLAARLPDIPVWLIVLWALMWPVMWLATETFMRKEMRK